MLRPCFGASRRGGVDLLVVGLSAAGKTLLLRQLQGFCAPVPRSGLCSSNQVQPLAEQPRPPRPTIATIGTELHDIHLGSHIQAARRSRRQLRCREVGGQMLPLWPHFFEECSALLYVIDCSCSGEGEQQRALQELRALLQHEALQGKPVCVALNKRDLVASSQAPEKQRQQAQESVGQSLEQQVQELQRGLEAAAGGQPQQPQLLLVHTSAVTGAGMQQLAEWLGGGYRCMAAQQGQHAPKECCKRSCRWKAITGVAPAPG